MYRNMYIIEVSVWMLLLLLFLQHTFRSFFGQQCQKPLMQVYLRVLTNFTRFETSVWWSRFIYVCVWHAYAYREKEQDSEISMNCRSLPYACRLHLTAPYLYVSCNAFNELSLLCIFLHSSNVITSASAALPETSSSGCSFTPVLFMT